MKITIFVSKVLYMLSLDFKLGHQLRRAFPQPPPRARTPLGFSTLDPLCTRVPRICYGLSHAVGFTQTQEPNSAMDAIKYYQQLHY